MGCEPDPRGVFVARPARRGKGAIWVQLGARRPRLANQRTVINSARAEFRSHGRSDGTRLHHARYVRGTGLYLIVVTMTLATAAMSPQAPEWRLTAPLTDAEKARVLALAATLGIDRPSMIRSEQIRQPITCDALRIESVPSTDRYRLTWRRAWVTYTSWPGSCDKTKTQRSPPDRRVPRRPAIINSARAEFAPFIPPGSASRDAVPARRSQRLRPRRRWRRFETRATVRPARRSPGRA